VELIDLRRLLVAPNTPCLCYIPAFPLRSVVGMCVTGGGEWGPDTAGGVVVCGGLCWCMYISARVLGESRRDHLRNTRYG
jgi:hypothetical protein